jgi:hypothetical protein
MRIPVRRNPTTAGSLSLWLKREVMIEAARTMISSLRMGISIFSAEPHHTRKKSGRSTRYRDLLAGFTYELV